MRFERGWILEIVEFRTSSRGGAHPSRVDGIAAADGFRHSAGASVSDLTTLPLPTHQIPGALFQHQPHLSLTSLAMHADRGLCYDQRVGGQSRAGAIKSLRTTVLRPQAEWDRASLG